MPLVLILFSIICFTSYGQREANIWYFGQYAGLDFNSGVPVPLLNGRINRWEGVACFSDSLGNLLFYTDGDSIWNKFHLPMKNGVGLGGHNSSTESAIIVPLPKNDSVYYVFTVDAEGGPNGLAYSIVNIRRFNDSGEVVVKNIKLIDRVSEKVTAVKHQNNKDFWIISHEWNTDSFYVFLLTDTGLSSPIIQEIGTGHYDIGPHGNNAVGYMRASPNGSKLALVLQVNEIIEVYDFDNLTGIISNPIIIHDTLGSPYGVEFSPDSKMLYFTSRFSLFQVDLSSNNQQQINNSLKLIGSSPSNNFFGALQLATNGKIYLAHDNQPYLGVINNPTDSGLNCNFVLNGVYLQGRLSRLGLPNFIQSYFLPPEIIVQNTCYGDSTVLFLKNSFLFDSLHWFYKENTSYKLFSKKFLAKYVFPKDSLYSILVKAYKNSEVKIFSTIVKINTLPRFYLPKDTTFCANDSLCLSVNLPNVKFYWSTGDTLNFVYIKRPGLYWLFTKDIYTQCVFSDTLKVNTLAPPFFQLPKDTFFCEKDTLILGLDADNVSFLWSDSTTNNFIKITEEGYYWLKITDSNQCSYSDTVFVRKNSLPYFSLAKDTILCENTSITLTAPPNLKYLWSTSENTQYITIDKPGMYWCRVTDSNFCSFTDTLIVESKAKPFFFLPMDTILCDTQILVLNLPPLPFDFYWFDGTTTDYKVITTSGEYWLTATNICGEFSDTINVLFKYCGPIDIPNIFTPNNDNINDFFYIKGIEESEARLFIYNKWGHCVYFSQNYQNNWDARGLPEGVYYYILIVNKSVFKGFITVVR